jgi:hypothetical protein
MSESKTSEKRIEAVDRQQAALELRRDGLGFAEIAARLGYGGPSGAYKAVMAGLHKTLREPAAELRNLELTRLDDMLKATWGAAQRGVPQAVDRVLKIMERRAKYLGLDAPATVNINIRQEATRMAEDYDLDPDELIAEAERIVMEYPVG